MHPLAKKIDDFFIRNLWEKDVHTLGRIRRIPFQILRVIYTAVRGLSEEELALRAMSLVYTTLLAIVPLLAVSLSVLKAFGVHTRFEIFLYYFLEPLGPNGVDLAMKIIEFVENVKVSVLGSIGLSILIYTVISLVQKVERALNSMWNVKGTRSFVRRFSNYMSVLLVGPVLIFSAQGIRASLMNTSIMQKLFSIEPFGSLLVTSGKILPYAFICLAFTLIYIFLPNTKVRFASAFVGGIFAAVLLESTTWGFRSFIVSSAKYSAIYSGFAIIILSMIWLYLNWFILLVGARVAFYHQYPHFLNAAELPTFLGSRTTERLALEIMYLIGRNFHLNLQPWTFSTLVEQTGVHSDSIHGVMTLLADGGLITSTGDDIPAYLPARDLDTIAVRDVLDVVRLGGEENIMIHPRKAQLSQVDGVMQRLDEAIAGSLGNETIKSLVLSGKTVSGM